MKTVNGESPKIKKNIVGILSSERVPLRARGKTILFTEKIKNTDLGYAGIISTRTSPSTSIVTASVRVSPQQAAFFKNGDIVKITPSGDIHFLWETEQIHNVLFLTEACNCHCIMCPQPPQKHDQTHLNIANKILDILPSGYEGEICITGGEPTLCGNNFLEVLAKSRSKHPNARILVLTNGKTFSEFDFTKSFAELNSHAALAVSLHADTDDLHDRIVEAKGSFRKTQKGLYNLGKFRQPVEIRIVISKLNAHRLTKIAEHIYRNYPFAFHVTFMALEITGLAFDNLSNIWIDPYDYRDELELALHELHRRGIRVSAYNHPLCLLHKNSWEFARQSISTWKQDYLPECERCSKKEQCCGFFTTSGDILSKHINSIRYDQD